MRGLHRDGVHHGINGHARQSLLLFDRYAQSVEGINQCGINFVKTFWRSLGFRGRIIAYGLEIDRRNAQVRPVWRGERQPISECLEAEVKQPFGLMLLLGYKTDDFFTEASGDNICINILAEPVFIFSRSRAGEHFIVLVFGRVTYVFVLFHRWSDNNQTIAPVEKNRNKQSLSEVDAFEVQIYTFFSRVHLLIVKSPPSVSERILPRQYATVLKGCRSEPLSLD